MEEIIVGMETSVVVVVLVFNGKLVVDLKYVIVDVKVVVLHQVSHQLHTTFKSTTLLML